MSENEEPRPKQRRRPEEASVASASHRTSSTREPSTMKEIKDQEQSSNDEGMSNAEQEDDFEEEPSDNDDDVFQGRFALKDKDDRPEPSHEARMNALPPKLAAIVQNFEPAVLESIPLEVGENLGCKGRGLPCWR